MNKKLLSVAIGAALAGSIGIAQADVQLYGQADVSVDSHDCDTGGCAGYAASKGLSKNDNSQKMNMNGNFSFIGVKGSEDLGNGLKAIFNVMFAYDPAGNNTAGYGSTNTLSDNEAWVGLAGDFGTFRAGTVTTPYSDHGAMIDPFFGTSLEGNVSGLQSNFLHSEYTAGDAANGLSNRTMRYDSPDMNGLGAGAFYTLGGHSITGNPAGNQDNPYGLGVHYKNGNILGFADYVTSSEGDTIRKNNKAWDLGGQYTMGNIAMFAMYERGGLVGNTNSDNSANVWHLGGSFKMGNTLLYAAYGEGDAKDPASTANKSKNWTLGAKHNLSMRTSVYAGYSESKIDDTAGPSAKDDHFGLGMNVKF